MLSIWNPDITLEIPSGSFSESEQNNFFPATHTVIVIIEGGKNQYRDERTFHGGRLAWSKYVVSRLFDEINLLIVNHCRSKICWNPRKSLRYPFRETFLQGFISVSIVLTPWKYTGFYWVLKTSDFFFANKNRSKLNNNWYNRCILYSKGQLEK